MITRHQLLTWLMTATGLGPGIGDAFFVAKADSAHYYWLRDDLRLDPAHLFQSPELAYPSMIAGRNDVMLISPGAYDIDTELAWNKAHTHLIGLGGPNTWGDWSEPNVCIYSDNVATTAIINVTGANCIFKNATVQNYGANAACLHGFILDKYGCYFENMTFGGVMTSTNDATAGTSALNIMGDGMYPIFKNCRIGQDVWDEREANNTGQLLFGDTSGRPNGGLFKDCIFPTRSVTAAVASVSIPAAQAIGRGWVFDNCHFSNFYDGTTLLTQVFYTVTGTQPFAVSLRHCTAQGYTEWQTGDFNVVCADMPITATAGGLMKAPTGTVGN